MTQKTDQLQTLHKDSSRSIWQQELAAKMPKDWAKEIDEFEVELHLKKAGKIEEKVFAESRLRRGAYGQRYDNGTRHDGGENKTIPFPCGNLTKGPNTVWDAPGMERIKIPYGGLNPEQMDVLADLAEEYADSICHITTRQDIQLHYVHIEDTPSMFRRLAAVGITTREACGNSVRNVTACPLSGVCHDESFDVTPYADAMFRFLLGHPDVQDFGRKFKIAFSGCKQHPCGLTGLHDLGLIARVKDVNGQKKRGFEYYVGGGLGAVPFQAKLFDDFVPEEEMLPLTQAVCRIFARHGEKQKRNRARIKFLVSDWGIEKFRTAVLDERKKIKTDPRWLAFLYRLADFSEKPFKATTAKAESPHEVQFEEWLVSNVRSQKQAGYCTVAISCPLGDVTSNQMRGLADVVRKYVGKTIRTTVEQNFLLRWVRREDLKNLHQDLQKMGLAIADAGTIVDITACPATDTCKLGVASSRGLAGELRQHLAEKSLNMDRAIKNFRIKISGCFNSCGQQHIADLGFYGISRKVGNYVVPHFQVVVGGQMQNNAGSYGLPVVGIPSKNIPLVVDRLTTLYVGERRGTESFQDFIKRLGKVAVKKALDDLTAVPTHEADSSFYTDWGDVREFATSDIGKGECAGEVVSLVDMGLKQADREVFEAQVSFDGGQFEQAASQALGSMLRAAQALIKGKNPDISEDAKDITHEFKKNFIDNQLFFDPFAGDKFANYLFRAQAKGTDGLTEEQVHHRIEEAQLFIEAAYACNVRMSFNK